LWRLLRSRRLRRLHVWLRRGRRLWKGLLPVLRRRIGRLTIRRLTIGLLLWRSRWRLLRSLWLHLRRRRRLHVWCNWRLWPLWRLWSLWRCLQRRARGGHFVRPCAEDVAARLHLGEIGRRRWRSQLNVRDEHDRATRAELHTRPGLNFRRLCDPPAIQESAEARIGIDEQATPVLEPKLCVAARYHRPFRLVENDMTLRRVAPDLDVWIIKGALLTLLSGTLFYQNDFHDGYLNE
jgi:hypothetical protein